MDNNTQKINTQNKGYILFWTTFAPFKVKLMSAELLR